MHATNGLEQVLTWGNGFVQFFPFPADLARGKIDQKVKERP